MSFLNATLFAWLLPLLTVPLLIHLLNRSFPKRFLFPDVRHLKQTLAQRSKLYTWRHRILLLLRTAFLLMVLQAFLKPVWERYGSVPAGGGPRHVLLLLDRSLSMEYTGGGVSPRRRALTEADKILDTLAEDDLVNVLFIHDRIVPCFVSLSQDHRDARRFLSRAEAGYGRADMSAANRSAAEQFAGVEGTKEIYYLSDFQRRTWAHVDFTSVPPDARCFYVNTGVADTGNRGVLDARFDSAQIRAGDAAQLEVTVGNFSDQPYEGPVALTVNDEARLEQEVFVDPWSTGALRFPVLFGSPGHHRLEIQLPDDELAADNRFYVTREVRRREPILVVSDADDADRAAAFFLRTALNPYDADEGPTEPLTCGAAELDGAHLAMTRKLFMTETGPLDDGACERVAEFVFQGGGVLYFLDGDHDRDNLARMADAFGEMPLELQEKRSLEQVVSGGQQIRRGDFRSPFLSLFRGAQRRNLGLLEFYDFYYASPTGSGRILLHYADETPAMAALQHGLGTLLLMNLSVREISSNLARQRIFPAWIHDLVHQLDVAGITPDSVRIGEAAQGEIWKDQLDREGVLGPDGRRYPMTHERLGARYAIGFTPSLPGFYTLGSGAGSLVCGANPPGDESDLRPVDIDQLPQQSEGDTIGQVIAAQEDYEHVTRGIPIFHYFLFAAFVFLLAEGLFQLLLSRAEAT